MRRAKALADLAVVDVVDRDAALDRANRKAGTVGNACDRTSLVPERGRDCLEDRGGVAWETGCVSGSDKTGEGLDLLRLKTHTCFSAVPATIRPLAESKV